MITIRKAQVKKINMLIQIQKKSTTLKKIILNKYNHYLLHSYTLLSAHTQFPRKKPSFIEDYEEEEEKKMQIEKNVAEQVVCLPLALKNYLFLLLLFHLCFFYVFAFEVLCPCQQKVQ